jgi:hypothetical protein
MACSSDHAHAHDFEIDGVPARSLFGNTKPEVIMQPDTSNCCDGGAPVVVLKYLAAPAAFIKRTAVDPTPSSAGG